MSRQAGNACTDLKPDLGPDSACLRIRAVCLDPALVDLRLLTDTFPLGTGGCYRRQLRAVWVVFLAFGGLSTLPSSPMSS